MQTDALVCFDDMPVDEGVRSAALEHVAHLEKLHGRITGCKVVISQPHRHHRDGRLTRVRVEVIVPGGEVVVSRDQHLDHSHEDVRVALRDAFHAARRRLEDHVRRRRGMEKQHRGRLHGRVKALFPSADHGFIAVDDGSEAYFHRHSLSDRDFRLLEIGTPVFLTVEDGEQGPQATAVHLEHPHGRVAHGGGASGGEEAT